MAEIENSLSSDSTSTMDVLLKAEEEARDQNLAAESAVTQENVDEVKAMDALNSLLSKAMQYTDFLNKKRISMNENGAKRVKKNPQPVLLTGGTLREYQVEGYRWMVGLFENGLNGILGDEMGLGKTVQTIALFAHLIENGVNGPFLMVVPLSTLTNWIREINKWMPTIEAIQYHGIREERRQVIPDLKKKFRGTSNQFIMVTTYEILIRDRALLQQYKWQYVVVDEGHRLKNYKCLLFKELTILCRGSVLHGGANRLLLTGTPLQNNLTELWSLLHFLMPEIFDSLEFFQSVFAFDAKISQKEDQSIVKDQESKQIVSKLHKILAPFMLRRLKTEVEKNLPEKVEVVIYCPMPSAQEQMYRSMQEKTLRPLISQFDKSFSKKSLQNTLMQLRKICQHPFLQYEAQNSSGEFDTDKSLINNSGKMLVLDYMLQKLTKAKHKVLIFSQFTTMLDIIEDYIRVLRPSYGLCRIDGNVGIQERMEQMDEFNDVSNHSKTIFLLSTRSGGVGINLVAADTVILFDSDFNPHMDNQAQDRAHRIGQTQDVAVYRFITGNSIELRILERANDKRKLERVVCANRGRKKVAMDKNELERLLKDDFSGHTDLKNGCIEKEDFNTTLKDLLNRELLFPGKGREQRMKIKGKGYEIVEHKGATIVGAVL